MNKDQYLWMLRSNLGGLPPEEIDNVIEYYREYFEDAGEENEQRVIEELGAPINLADKIRADFTGGSGAGWSNGGQFNGYTQNGYGPNGAYGQNGGYAQNNPYGQNGMYGNGVQRTKSPGTIVLMVVLAVVTCPIWGSLLIALAAVLFAFAVTLVALAGGLIIAGAAIFFGGLAAVAMGIYTLFTHMPTGIAVLGNGLLLTGLGMLSLLLDVWIAKWIIHFMVFVFNKIKTAIQSRKERKNNEKVY